MRLMRRVRCAAACALAAYGRAVLGIAEMLAPDILTRRVAPRRTGAPAARRPAPPAARRVLATHLVPVPDSPASGPPASLRPASDPAPPDPDSGPDAAPWTTAPLGSIDATRADLSTLRAAALDSVLAAAADPGRDPAVLFGARVHGVSQWTASRLLTDTERLRRAAVEMSRSIADADGRVQQRRFCAALLREFPWLDDAAAYGLWEHVVDRGATVRR